MKGGLDSAGRGLEAHADPQAKGIHRGSPPDEPCRKPTQARGTRWPGAPRGHGDGARNGDDEGAVVSEFTDEHDIFVDPEPRRATLVRG